MDGLRSSRGLLSRWRSTSVVFGQGQTSKRALETSPWAKIARTFSGAWPSILHWFQLLLLCSALAYVVWQNTFLSEDWWYLPLRDIDDMAMNAATEEMRQALSEGAWAVVASFTAYAYGAGFYLLMTIITLPAHLVDSPQIQIIIGRNASLAAVFLTSLVVALIGRRVFPEHRKLWLVALGCGLITPIALIDSTKMHVNGWSTLFGVLAIYLLIHEIRLSRTFMYLASFAIGAAIGFKLTALAVLPLFAVILFARFAKDGRGNLIGSFAVVLVTAVLTGAPALLFYPIYPQFASPILNRLLSFVDANSGDDGNDFERFWDALGFYGHPFALICLLALTVLLLATTKGPSPQSLRVILPLAVAGSAILTWALLFVVVDKEDIYLATYALNISVFLPMGVFAIGTVRVWPHLQPIIGWALICASLILGPHFNGWVAGSQNYAAKASSSDIERKLVAASEIHSLIGEVPAGTKVLLDSSSVFPFSHIGTGVPIHFLYGNLGDRLARSAGQPAYTYIVLDSNSYWGGPTPAEETVRAILREDGLFGSSEYDLAYSRNGTELYIHKPR